MKPLKSSIVSSGENALISEPQFKQIFSNLEVIVFYNR